MKDRLGRPAPGGEERNKDSVRRGSVWKKLARLTDAAFVAGVVALFLAGLLQSVLLPGEMSEFENRYAAKLTLPTAATWLDGSFQENTDNALGDQVTLSSTFKNLYNRLNTALQKLTGDAVLASSDYFGDHYLWLDGTRLFGKDTLVYGCYPREELDKLAGRIDHYNEVFSAHPDTEFFLYYIEKETDLDLESGEKMPFYPTLREGLDLPGENMACFEINSFEDFSANFYKTDHHWDYRGSYKGYGQVMALLGCADPLLEPVETVTTPGEFSGSKARTSGVMFTEPFTAYRFDFPAMAVTINGWPADDYGNQPGYLSGAWGAPTYSEFYGGDDGEIIFDTGRPERENVLLIGESYDNALLKLVASHYDRTHSVDLRYYEGTMGEPFVLGDYLAEHDIDKVLLIGNVDYYLKSDFELGE